MLWQCKDNNESWWSNEKITSCVSTLSNRLKVSFSSKYFPHYFILDINLPDNVAAELIHYGQATLESIWADPTVCMLEILEEIHNEEIPKFGKFGYDLVTLTQKMVTTLAIAMVYFFNKRCRLNI